jgi:ABC-type phosphate transport system substrate-binding protein
MRFRSSALPFSCLVAAVALTLAIVGCNNTFNPLCASSRPAPVIGSISPATVPFTQVQNGTTLTISGSNFVSSTLVMIGSKPISAKVISPTKLTVKVNTGVITGPGEVKVAVDTPAGNTGELGCTSGGKSSVLTLTVN